jgi:hypothetical protein
MQESKSKFVLNPRTATIYTNVEYKNSKNLLRDANREGNVNDRRRRLTPYMIIAFIIGRCNCNKVQYLFL